MIEVDRSSEREWFMVNMGYVAAFVVNAATEDHALLLATYYCNENDWLGLDPDNMLECTIYGKPLEPMDEVYYDKVNRGNPSTIRYLGSLTQTYFRPSANAEKPRQTRGQLLLFS